MFSANILYADCKNKKKSCENESVMFSEQHRFWGRTVKRRQQIVAV